LAASVASVPGSAAKASFLRRARRAGTRAGSSGAAGAVGRARISASVSGGTASPSTKAVSASAAAYRGGGLLRGRRRRAGGKRHRVGPHALCTYSETRLRRHPLGGCDLAVCRECLHALRFGLHLPHDAPGFAQILLEPHQHLLEAPQHRIALHDLRRAMLSITREAGSWGHVTGRGNLRGGAGRQRQHFPSHILLCSLPLHASAHPWRLAPAAKCLHRPRCLRVAQQSRPDPLRICLHPSGSVGVLGCAGVWAARLRTELNRRRSPAQAAQAAQECPLRPSSISWRTEYRPARQEPSPGAQAVALVARARLGVG
jgi:hypothetical protein